jgi:hypothetical protein
LGDPQPLFDCDHFCDSIILLASSAVRVIPVADTPRHLRQEHKRTVDRDERKQRVMAPVSEPGCVNDHPDQADERKRG